jgi:hypothetical protein
MLGEVLLSVYAGITIAVAVGQQNWWTVPFLFIYATGFGYMVGAALWQAFAARFSRSRWRRQQAAYPSLAPPAELHSERRVSEIQA